MDFPHGKGVIREELLVTPSAAVRKAIDTLKPVVLNGPDECPDIAQDLAIAEGLKAVCSVPLVNRGEGTR